MAVMIRHDPDLIPVEEIDPAWGHWFAGFVDGEGYFSTHVSMDTRWGQRRLTLEFGITLRRDDEPILLDCIRELGLPASLTYYESMTNKTGIVSKPRVRMTIKHQSGLWRLCEIFERFPLRAKKARDLERFRAILTALRDTPRYAPRDHIFALVEDLRDGRRYDGPDSGPDIKLAAS